jgi:hypothetical protein
MADNSFLWDSNAATAKRPCCGGLVIIWDAPRVAGQDLWHTGLVAHLLPSLLSVAFAA